MKQSPHNFRPHLLATLIATMAHGSAFAESVQIPDITVTGSPSLNAQTPNAVEIDAEALQSLRTTTSDSASLLRNIPGLNLQNGGGVSNLPVIHGMASDRLRIKVDGMDLISACGNYMNPPLSYIDPTNVGSATVFTGITPVSVGGDSIGGTILVNSARPEFATAGEGILHQGEIGASYRSNGDAYTGNIAATIANEKISLSYRGSITEADNYDAGGNFKAAGAAASGRGYLDGDEVGSTMYKSTNHSIALGLRHENHLVEVKVGLQDIPYQGWSNQRMDMTGNDSTQVNLSYEGDFDWGILEARAYHEKTRHEMQFYDDKLFWYGPNITAPATDGIPCTPSAGMNGCAAGMPMDTEGENTGVTIKANIALSERDTVRLGGEIQHYQLDDWWNPSGKAMWPNVFWNINDGERDRYAVFSEWEAQWNTQWLTQLGVRYERVEMDAGTVQGYNTTSAQYAAESAAFNAADRDKSDDNFDLTAVARFTPDRSRTIEFGYARKTRSPSLYERYTWSTSEMVMRMVNMAGDGNGYVGNLDLNEEIAHTLSATFDWHDEAQERWGLTVTPYFTYIKDYIDVRRCVSANSNCGTANQTATDDFVYLQFDNQSARIYGLDLAGHYPLAENSQYGDFTAKAMLNYIRGKNRDTNDDLYNIMPLNGRLAVVHKKGSWNNTIELELVNKKTRTSDVRNELETAGYGLLHLRSNYQWKQVSIDFGVENALDKLYDHPLGGTYIGQGKTMTGTDIVWGTQVPGMGRSIYAGVNYQF